MARRQFQSTAEKAFNERLGTLRERKPEGPSMTIDEHYKAPLDTAGIEKVFSQYGTYLELVGGDGPAEQQVVVTLTRGKGLTPTLKKQEVKA
ncbi:MAG: hypothetical protein HOV97_05620 [Nonomuraea sp.]|nr:hypothetical protein [Nonomuraea sp.]